MKKYIVKLTCEERATLEQLLKTGKSAASKIAHASILLKADASSNDAPAWHDQRIADAFNVSVATVERIRERFVLQGLDAALNRKPRSDTPLRKLDGAAEARLIALACSKPPEGRTAWTLHLLADKLVELQIVESISHETVRQVLKKTSYSRT